MNIALMDDPVTLELIYVDQYFLEIFNFNLLAGKIKDLSLC